MKIYITAEIGKLKAEVDKAKKEIDKFSKESKADFEEFNEEFQKVGDKSKAVVKGIVAGLAGLAAGFLALGSTTKEYREGQAKLATAFETAGASADTAKQTYNDLYRVMGDSDTAVEAAGHLAKLTTNEKDLSEWTKICQGVYATFGESIPIESLTEAANETAKTGEITGALADALSWAGVNQEQFAEELFWCNTEAEREKLIRTTLSGVYDEAADKYEKNAEGVIKQNEAQAKLNDAMAKLGEVAAPVTTMLAEFGAELIEKLEPHLPAISDALTKVGDAIGDVLSWVIDNWELVKTIAIVIGAISAALTIFSTVMGIVNAVMLASPITWIILGIVAAIAAIVAIIVVVIKYWDEIKAATKKAWDAIVNAIKTAIDWVINLFNKIINFVKTNWKGLLLLLVNPFAGAFKLIYDNCEGVRNKVDSIFKKIKDSITNAINKAKDAVKSAIDKIKGFFNFKFSWPKLKMPSITVTWKQSPKWLAEAAKFLGMDGVPSFGVNWNALGGVFDKPTVFGYGNSLQGIGEDGAEAVVPLENNLEWLNKLADMLNERMGGGTPIVLTVDGKVFGQTAINTINQNTKQTGKLGLKIM